MTEPPTDAELEMLESALADGVVWFRNWDRPVHPMGTAKWMLTTDEMLRLVATIRAERRELARLREAAQDALGGWRYIRRVHGDLDGVGWDRVEQALAAALAGTEGEG